ncbi:hypothetical protein M9H77_04529 [Catharanthus roseus]|uniref:Uncharacterized protein n=1 Tax=Catharanthus roseus TaxID=4058 RepID=A0ACC0CEC7_CATRO|nr:hypothetical protein M9H77_04529 [Catharanthus roseus]
MISVSVMFLILQHQRLGDTFAYDALYRKLHTHIDDHERTWQFHILFKIFLEFQKQFCTLKARKTEEHRQNGAPMPTDMELMCEVAAVGALFLVASSEHQTEDIARRRSSNRLLTPNYILHKVVAVPINAVGILMSELGCIEPPPDWQMPSYPSKGTSTAGPRYEDDDHLPL